MRLNPNRDRDGAGTFCEQKRRDLLETSERARCLFRMHDVGEGVRSLTVAVRPDHFTRTIPVPFLISPITDTVSPSFSRLFLIESANAGLTITQ